MRTHFVAFLLACLTLGGISSLLTFSSYRSAQIIVAGKSDLDIDQAIKAINGLHLNGAVIAKAVNEKATLWQWILSSFDFALLFVLLTGFILFLYKFYCRLMRVTPHL